MWATKTRLRRLYGFFPMSTFIVLTPGSVGRTEVVDSSAHRTGLPHVYNVYQKCDSDPLYAAEIEDVSPQARRHLTACPSLRIDPLPAGS